MDPVTVNILHPTLTGTSQIGNRFYFTSESSIGTRVLHCTLLTEGLELLGTITICSTDANASLFTFLFFLL